MDWHDGSFWPKHTLTWQLGCDGEEITSRVMVRCKNLVANSSGQARVQHPAWLQYDRFDAGTNKTKAPGEGHKGSPKPLRVPGTRDERSSGYVVLVMQVSHVPV